MSIIFIVINSVSRLPISLHLAPNHPLNLSHLMLIQKEQSHIREIILLKYYEKEQQFKVQPIFLNLFIATLLIIKMIHSGNE